MCAPQIGQSALRTHTKPHCFTFLRSRKPCAGVTTMIMRSDRQARRWTCHWFGLIPCRFLQTFHTGVDLTPTLNIIDYIRREYPFWDRHQGLPMLRTTNRSLVTRPSTSVQTAAVSLKPPSSTLACSCRARSLPVVPPRQGRVLALPGDAAPGEGHPHISLRLGLQGPRPQLQGA